MAAPAERAYIGNEIEPDNYKELIEQAIADEPDEFYRLISKGE